MIIDRIGIDIGVKKSVEDGLSWAAAHGLRYVDFRLDTSPEAFAAFTPERCDATRARAEASGITIGLHTLSAVNIAEFSPYLAEAADHYLRAYINIAQALHAGWVDVHAGYHFTSDVAQRKVAGRERLKRAVTDNPLVFPEANEVLSGGNFHGEPVALAADYLGMALAELASIAERRIAHLLDPAVSELPGFLTTEGGLNSGFMLAQVTAAALVSENKVLSHPASVDSIPTSANKEDHVSMGTLAAYKTADVVENVGHVLAIELLCAVQALDMRGAQLHLTPSPTTAAVRALVRSRIPFWDEDRLMHHAIEEARSLIATGNVVQAAEAACGSLY